VGVLGAARALPGVPGAAPAAGATAPIVRLSPRRLEIASRALRCFGKWLGRC
jgi:hypothetical protein